MNQYNVIGVMSGSSLDGVDICMAIIQQDSGWSFDIIKSITIKLPSELKERLKGSPELSGYDLQILNIEYGKWLGDQINRFKTGYSEIEIVGIHGHTVFHDPENRLSLQIGSGSMVSHITGLSVVDDFRTKDLLAGGQGAPLVPFGDISLFNEYDAWVNLGGIANCTVISHDKVLAWDIAPCNQVLNHFASLVGKEYDKDGVLARQGKTDQLWLKHLQSLSFIEKNPPKSMSNQWIRKHILSHPLPEAKDGLFTFVEFLSRQIVIDLLPFVSKGGNVLFTGGGAHNKYLMSAITELFADNQINAVVPSETIIDFKEALIFGFLGLLRKLELPNTLASATGAEKNMMSGQLHLP